MHTAGRYHDLLCFTNMVDAALLLPASGVLHGAAWIAAPPVLERSARLCAARRSATRSAPSAGRLRPLHAALMTASRRRTCSTVSSSSGGIAATVHFRI